MKMEMNEQIKEISSMSGLLKFTKEHTDFNSSSLEWTYLIKVYKAMTKFGEHVRNNAEEDAIVEQMDSVRLQND